MKANKTGKVGGQLLHVADVVRVDAHHRGSFVRCPTERFGNFSPGGGNRDSLSFTGGRSLKTGKQLQ